MRLRAGALPTVIPRLITLCLAAAFLRAGRRRRLRQQRRHLARTANRDRGTLVGAASSDHRGAPSRACGISATSLWQFFRGPATAKEPSSPELSRRYTELLFENLGQPGFRELIVATLDLETRGDLVFAALGEERRRHFFSAVAATCRPRRRRPEPDSRRAGGCPQRAGADRAAPGRVLAGKLLEGRDAPHLRSHRAVARLLEELAAAGVEQVIMVCAGLRIARRLIGSQSRRVARSRVAEHLSAAETSAVRDAVVASQRNDSRASFSFSRCTTRSGRSISRAYDERSDRYQSLAS